MLNDDDQVLQDSRMGPSDNNNWVDRIEDQAERTYTPRSSELRRGCPDGHGQLVNRRKCQLTVFRSFI